MKIRNPKSEIRIKVWLFKHLNFDIVSKFVLRASSLNHGFTLIEVLVAATIIALLSTIGLSGYQAITRSGRDALRKSDLEQLRSALEIYKAENGAYPAPTDTCVAALSSSYINPYPADSRPSVYKYCYNRLTNLTYALCAHLENGADTDYPAECGGVNKCIDKCNYKVVNP